MSLELRVEQLEMKLAFQDENLNTLNDEIFHQQKQMQKLTEQISVLVIKLKEATPSSNISTQEDRPPHY
jgi:SlyX protein